MNYKVNANLPTVLFSSLVILPSFFEQDRPKQAKEP